MNETENWNWPGHFEYRDGELHCEQLRAEELAEEYETPCYVYSAASFRERFRNIRDAFSEWDPLVCFSIKSCGNLSVLKLLNECGSGFDVVSGGEIFRALKAGADPEKIVYAGVGKTREEIAYALRKGIKMFNVESGQELRTIDHVAKDLGTVGQVALRVNPDVDPGTHEKTTTGKKENKFGIGLGIAEELTKEAQHMSGVNVRGFHVHLGSPITSTKPYELAMGKLVEFVTRVRTAGCDVDTINIGGGYCISHTGEKVTQPREYAAAVRNFLEKLDCQVIIEPGRYIAGNSGILLTKVIYRKESSHGKVFLICDAGMNDLMRPTLYDAFHRIWPVCSEGGVPEVTRPDDTRYDGFDTEKVDVVGPVCESGDYLAKDRTLPVMPAGRLLAVFSTGAYGSTMSSNYNARPRPPEILVDGQQARMVRRRETRDDLVAGEADLL